MIARIAFAALAVVDAVLWFSLFFNFGWFNFTFPNISESIASLVIIPLLWTITILDRLVFAAFFAAVATGIWKDISGRERPRWLAVISTPVLMLGLCAVGVTWFAIVNNIVSKPPGFIHDRLTFFDALAMHMRIGDIEMLGGVSYASQSIGRFLIFLLGLLYLGEKYLVQAWRARWPVPISPVIAIGWIGWIVFGGEYRVRQYVAAQQWRPSGPELSWLEAVTECEALGEGWRLPHREELTRFLATEPADLHEWKGAAWTNASARGGDWAIGVDLAPRRSGRWNKASEPTRDESLCEHRDQPGYASDWFTGYRERLCARTTQSQYLYTPGLHPVALPKGATVFQPPAAAICVRSTDTATIPVVQRRGYDEVAFTRAADFRQAMAEQCARSPNGNRAACFAFAPDLPPFEETDDERTMRAFCEVVWNAEACHRYAVMMEKRPDAAERAARYRALACKRGFAAACSKLVL